MKLKLFLFSLLIFTINSSAITINLDPILEDKKLFGMGKNDFTNKWGKRFKFSWSGSDAGMNNSKIIGLTASKVNFSFWPGYLDRIVIYVGSSYSSRTSESWLRVNTEVLKSLRKKYGEPQEKNILKDLSVDMLWKTKNFNISLRSRAVNTVIRNANFCEIILYRKNLRGKKREYDPSLYGAFVKTLQAKVEKEFSGTGITSNELKSIERKIRALKHSNSEVGAKIYFSTRTNEFWSKYDAKDLFFGFFTSYAFESETPPNRSHSKVICKNGLISKVVRMSTSKGKFSVSSVSSYFYDKNKVLRAVMQNIRDDIDHFWLDYDKDGRLARVIHFNKFKYTSHHLTYFNKDYNKLFYIKKNIYSSKPEFGVYDGEKHLYSDNIIPAKLSGYVHDYLFRNSHKPTRYYQYTSSQDTFLLTKQAFKKADIRHFLVNVDLQEYKPVNPVNNEKVKNLLEMYNGYMKELTLYVKQTLDKKNILLKSDNIFQDMYESKTVVIDEKIIKIPFSILKTADKAIQVKTNKGKLATISLNQTIYKRLKLVAINKSGAEFKDLQKNKIIFMPLNKITPLEVTLRVEHKNEIHNISEGQNFFGYKLTIRNGVLVFTKNDEEIRIQNGYVTLPNPSDAVSDHLIKRCMCNLAALQDRNTLDPAEQKRAEEAELDIKYFVEFCNIQIHMTEYKKLNNGASATGRGINSIYEVSKGVFKNIGQYYPVLLKPSYKAGKLYINGKSVSKKRENFRGTHDVYVAMAKPNLISIVYFIPNNAWTLKRLIGNFTVEVDGLKYDFSQKIKSDKNKGDLFNYEIFPENNIIKIDDTKYSLSFEKGKVILKHPEFNEPSALKIVPRSYVPL